MAKSHVKKVGNNYYATNKEGKIIKHKGHMTHKEAAKQVQAIYLSQHRKGK